MIKFERNKESMTDAIIAWEYQAGESFTDYFMDNWAFGSWAFFLLGRGHIEWANKLINENEAGNKPDQDEKFYWFGNDGYDSYSEEDYRKNVEVWADFLVSSDQYYRRVSKFFDEYFEKDAEDY